MSQGNMTESQSTEEPVRETQTESLGTGLQKYVARAQDASKFFSDLSGEGARLQAQVSALKKQLGDLTISVASKAALLGALETEIEAVRGERDVLRNEQVHHLEAQEWWMEREAHRSPGSPMAARDEKGRAIRRAHSEMMEKEKLAERIVELEKEHNDRMEEERAIAAGLRDRMGKLDGRVKDREGRIAELEKAEAAMKERFETYRKSAEERELKLRAEWNDMKAALDRANHERSASVASCMSPRALRTITPNIPVTPPRPSLSSVEPSSSQKSQTTPTTSLATRYVKLEERHAKLQQAYDEIRERFENDRRCFKEYKALQVARDARKRKKKEQKTRSSTKSSASRQGDPTPGTAGLSTSTPATSIPDADVPGEEEVEVEYESAEVRDAHEAREAAEAEARLPTEPGSTAMPSTSAQKPSRPPRAQLPTPPEVSKVPSPTAAQQENKTSRAVTARPVERQISTELRTIQVSDSRQLRREASHRHTITPVPENRQLGRTPSLDPLKKIEATRTTPWLGAATHRLGPTTSKGNVIDDLDDDMTDTPVQRPSTAGPSKTPLIRDRGDPSSLRRTALAQSIKPAAPATPAEAESSRKRALDMEDLTPAEKAQARKKLSKLSTSEKRQVYADYKGKGRYLAPSEVRKDVQEDYEIDPRQNEGVKHAFHDVKRGKEARKGMHGGDCECCKGYYEAVGPLPVYNAAPKWNDRAEEKDEGAAIEEHQQKVSRHRETWTKPATPPGYWSIGFPNTQEVEQQNEDADRMEAEKDARIRKEAAQKDGKWKKKTTAA